MIFVIEKCTKYISTKPLEKLLSKARPLKTSKKQTIRRTQQKFQKTREFAELYIKVTKLSLAKLFKTEIKIINTHQGQLIWTLGIPKCYKKLKNTKGI